MREPVMNRPRLAVCLLAALCLAGPASAENDQAASAPERSFEVAVKDSWIMGKLEGVYALNRHLNPFAINTDVNSGVVTLSGTVESEIDRDLAAELAKGVDGVIKIDNQLKVEKKTVSATDADMTTKKTERDFGQWASDVTTTARVKSNLLANERTQGLKINVDTSNNVVTLSGEVASSEERELAVQLAKNTSDVANVENKLVVH